MVGIVIMSSVSGNDAVAASWAINAACTDRVHMHAKAAHAYAARTHVRRLARMHAWICAHAHTHTYTHTHTHKYTHTHTQVTSGAIREEDVLDRLTTRRCYSIDLSLSSSIFCCVHA
jgi:hypothetical protein